MNFLLANWMLIAVVLASGAMLAWPMLTGGGLAGGITANEAVQMMNHKKAVVVDVCTTEEYAQAHIAGAKSVPLGELEAKLPSTVKNKALPLILVCATGMRSGRAVQVAKRLGYDNVVSLGGGLKSWRSANLPLVGA